PPPTPVAMASEKVPTTSALRLVACSAPERAPTTTAVISTAIGTRNMATTCAPHESLPRRRTVAAPNQPRADLFGVFGVPKFLEGGAVVLSWLSKQPFTLLFLVVAAGFALGRVKLKGIGLGATA